MLAVNGVAILLLKFAPRFESVEILRIPNRYP